MRSRGAAETLALHGFAGRLGEPRGIRSRSRDVDHALVRRGTPLAAVIISMSRGIIEIVRLREERVKGRVVVSRPWDVMIVHVHARWRDTRLVARARSASGDGARGDPTEEEKADLSTLFQQPWAGALRQPSIAAAIMIQTPRITAPPISAAATFLFSTISRWSSPGVHLSKSL